MLVVMQICDYLVVLWLLWYVRRLQWLGCTYMCYVSGRAVFPSERRLNIELCFVELPRNVQYAARHTLLHCLPLWNIFFRRKAGGYLQMLFSAGRPAVCCSSSALCFKKAIFYLFVFVGLFFFSSLFKPCLDHVSSKPLFLAFFQLLYPLESFQIM